MFFSLSHVFPLVLKCAGFSGRLWVRMEWLNTQVGMVFQLGWLSCVVAGVKELLLLGGAVQGRDEAQESQRVNTQIKLRGKHSISKAFPAPLGECGMGDHGLGVCWRGLSEPPELPSSALPGGAEFRGNPGGHHNSMEQPSAVRAQYYDAEEKTFFTV